MKLGTSQHLRDMMIASSQMLSLSREGSTHWVHSVGPISVSATTNKRHHKLEILAGAFVTRGPVGNDEGGAPV